MTAIMELEHVPIRPMHHAGDLWDLNTSQIYRRGPQATGQIELEHSKVPTSQSITVVASSMITLSPTPNGTIYYRTFLFGRSCPYEETLNSD